MRTLDRVPELRWVAIGGIMAVGLGYLLIHLAVSPALSIDGRVYAAAARAWLEGGDPWAVAVQDIRLTAPPPSLLAALPLALLAPEAAGGVSVLIALVAAMAAVRVARVGWWWLLSIPVLEGVLVGSFDLLALALVLGAIRGRSGWGALGAAIATLAKLYAIVPAIFLGRRGAVIAGLVALVATIPLLPWELYLQQLPEISARLIQQAGDGIGSPWATPWLVPPTVLALVLIGRRDGAWLLIPALWPATQVHYSVFMLPVGSPILALVTLLPVPAPAAVAVIALAIARAIQHRVDPWSWIPNRWIPRDRGLGTFGAVWNARNRDPGQVESPSEDAST
ncbi:MAG: hypothetical protein HW391_523 [Chloroflexi bacterium]|nr:hypothetical protein [Chloroflexota bacterium]